MIFNFTKSRKQGEVNVRFPDTEKLPAYHPDVRYGFVRETTSILPRKLSLDRIMETEEGYVITDNDDTIHWENVNQYNYGGMVFRIDIDEPGAYRVEVTTISSPKATSVALSGMIGDRLISPAYWDAAELVKRQNAAVWKNQTWSYEYVTAMNYMEIEIEPLLITSEKPENVNATVGVSRIAVTKLEVREKNTEEKPTIYLLGDSTVKSYIFEEAGMSGWGQVLYKLFDLNRVNVINYSMGGRSFKAMYCEGRLNEILMTGKTGDYVLVQSGHNDESTGSEVGPEARFGRGATAESYEDWIRKVFVPSIRSGGMIPVLITPMTRIDCSQTTEEHVALNGFKNSHTPGIDFPGIMKKTAGELGVSLLDLYEESIRYLKEIGGSAANAMFLSIEAGEYPSKTNSGSYANGNPYGRCDGTHFKECLSKQWARIVATEAVRNELEIADYLLPEVKTAITTGEWNEVYPEIAMDIRTGENAYYRNQIEKLLQIGVMKKDEAGNFHPKKYMNTQEFLQALCCLWELEINSIKCYENCTLTRELMAAISYDAYELRFGRNAKGELNRPKYMTDYNGTNLSPADPNYDPNLIGETAQYYPLTGWRRIVDTSYIDNQYFKKVYEAYHLGLIRCENGIRRGVMENGTLLEPKMKVTREKAAKALYYLWVLTKDIKEEDHRFS